MLLRRSFLYALAVLLLAACAPAPMRTTLPAHWRPSPNQDERRPNYIILHHTSDDTAALALNTLRDPQRQVSAHYLIARDGELYQLVDERRRAWHAGESKWGSDTDLNSASIGIELDNNGHEPFAQPLLATLLMLLRDITERHRIPPQNVLAHADVAPARKADPSRYFPWKWLADNGFGLWCDEPLPPPPVDFDPMLALQGVGYDVSDAASAIRAFRIHYDQDDSSTELSERDRALLYCLEREK